MKERERARARARLCLCARGVCVCARANVCVHARMHACMRAPLFQRVSDIPNLCIFTCMCVLVFMSLCVYICNIYVPVHAHTYNKVGVYERCSSEAGGLGTGTRLSLCVPLLLALLVLS